MNKDRKTTPPFFSIIIATYNRSELLKRAIESLLTQTEEDWEAIIVDDESTDDTYTQILPYLLDNNKIKYLRKSHSGEVPTKNKGLHASRGKFISFLDSDDEYHPEHLKFRKRLLLKHPTVRFLHGGLEVIGSSYVPDRFDYSKMIHLNDCVVGGTFFIERHLFLLLNGFREMPIGADAGLFERAQEAQVEMMKTRIPTYIYHRDTQDSITNRGCMCL
ncbi:MAG: glycosyltransferase family 2 protein [Cyclobacteriaceae bacterium]|nr:glycosyltransferase family 2 protein [Cyclobacteriaceae bacterium]